MELFFFFFGEKENVHLWRAEASFGGAYVAQALASGFVTEYTDKQRRQRFTDKSEFTHKETGKTITGNS